MKIISYSELKKLINSYEEYILIDVREPYEVEEYGKIPTSINIPLDELTKALDLPEKEQIKKYSKSFTKKDKLIFYCHSGGRSQYASALAESKGFNAINFSGSMIEWMRNERNK